MDQTLKNSRFSCGYKLWYVDFWYSKLYKAYFGEAVDNFLNDVIKASEYCSKVIETEFNKTLIIIKEDHEDFENSTKMLDL